MLWGSLVVLSSLIFGLLGLVNPRVVTLGSLVQLGLIVLLILDPKSESYNWGLGISLSFEYDFISLSLIGLAGFFVQ